MTHTHTRAHTQKKWLYMLLKCLFEVIIIEIILIECVYFGGRFFFVVCWMSSILCVQSYSTGEKDTDGSSELRTRSLSFLKVHGDNVAGGPDRSCPFSSGGCLASRRCSEFILSFVSWILSARKLASHINLEKKTTTAVQVSEFIFYTEVYFKQICSDKTHRTYTFVSVILGERLYYWFGWVQTNDKYSIYMVIQTSPILFKHKPICWIISRATHVCFRPAKWRWATSFVIFLGDYLTVVY